MHPLTERYPDLLGDGTDPALARLVADLDRLCAPEPLSPRPAVAIPHTPEKASPMQAPISLTSIPIPIGYVPRAHRAPRRAGWAALLLAAALPILAVLALVVVQRGRVQSALPQPGTHIQVPRGRVALAPIAMHADAARPGTWTFTGSMHQARGYHTATVLQSGMVLVAGGCKVACDTATNLTGAELYHPDSGTWTPTGSMHDPRIQFTATLLQDGQVLVAGGCRTGNCPTVLASTELYDPRTGKWARTGSMHVQRTFQTATLLPDGRVLVAGGVTGCNNGACTPGLASAELYDPRTGSWTLASSMHQARARPMATLLPDGRVLMAGGAPDGANNAYGSPLTSAEIYDPRTGTWTATGSMHQPRSAGAATLLPGGLVLVAGGWNGYGDALSAELYYPSTGTWTTTGSLLQAEDYEAGETATLLPNGQVLAAGNAVDPSGNPLTDAELYDPHTGSWTTSGALRQARAAQTTTLLHDGRVLVAGGKSSSDESTFFASAEIYQPFATAPSPVSATTARPGTWTLTGSMHQARGTHAAALLQDGTVLVAGGCKAPCDTTTNLTGAELYHPDTGTWTPTGSMHDPRIQFTMTRLPDGRVLAAGGCHTADCSRVLASAELYDPHTDTWTATGSLHGPRALQAATLLPDGRVLVVGGIDSGCNAACSPFLARSEIYDPRTGTWTLTGALHQARARPTATLLPDGRVLVTGGTTNVVRNDSGDPLASAEIYNPRAGTWSVTRPMHQPRSAHAATLLPSGLVLVTGGYNDPNGAVLPAELYHPRTGTWMVTGSLHHTYDYETGEAPTLLPNGQVLVAGNAVDDAGNALPNAELYDPATGTWMETGSLHLARVARALVDAAVQLRARIGQRHPCQHAEATSSTTFSGIRKLTAEPAATSRRAIRTELVSIAGRPRRWARASSRSTVVRSSVSGDISTSGWPAQSLRRNARLRGRSSGCPGAATRPSCCGHARASCAPFGAGRRRQ